MKIVALLPIKNEAWSLPVFLSSVKAITNDIIAVEDGSTDGSKEMLKKAGVKVYSLPVVPGNRWPMSKYRQFLLEKGRAMGGTHFIWLDADEAFTYPFVKNAQESIGKLKPGQKIMMPFLTLWKSRNEYRDKDGSLWDGNYKDFIVYDVPEYRFEEKFSHEARTEGPNAPENCIRIDIKDGAVLHFQAAAWEFFQTKQAFYRCSESINFPKEKVRVNQTYAVTLDDSSAKTSHVPEEWLKGIEIPENLEKTPPGWQMGQMLEWFDKYGIEYFEPLEIWHLPKLREEFVKRTGREPHSHWMSPFVREAGKIKWKIKRCLVGRT